MTAASSYFDIPACPAEVHRPLSPDPPFRFLDLPGEIQNAIVDDFIVSSNPITIRLPRYNRKPSPPPAPIAHPRFDKPVVLTPPPSRSPSSSRDQQYGHSRLALMLTCKKLYREHWRTYYGDNLFIFNMDIFREYAHNMPSRCWQNLKRIAFKMPHRHHHEGIWKMLGTMKNLTQIELWLPPTVPTDETVREAAVQGVKDCKTLKTVSIRRLAENSQEDDFDDLSENDKELQSYLDNLLDSRKTGKPMKKSSPPKLARKLTDPFTSGTSGQATESDE